MPNIIMQTFAPSYEVHLLIIQTALVIIAFGVWRLVFALGRRR